MKEKNKFRLWRLTAAIAACCLLCAACASSTNTSNQGASDQGVSKAAVTQDISDAQDTSAEDVAEPAQDAEAGPDPAGTEADGREGAGDTFSTDSEAAAAGGTDGAGSAEGETAARAEAGDTFSTDSEAAAAGGTDDAGSTESETAAAAEDVPDYSKEENWAYFGIGEDREADLFIICPTVDMNDVFNMSMDDTDTKESFLGALNMERGIYEDSTRMYAPYYRQAAMKVYGLDRESWEPYLALAYEDVSAAFSWYLENENGGRPIILAGFSQGADMCYRLLQDYFGEDARLEQLVAVYALGWPLTQEMVDAYPQLRPAQGADDTGVIISFDCEAPELTETFINPAWQKALSINPLNWRTDSVPADKSENLGACFTTYSGEIRNEIEGLCGCYIDEERGVLKVTGIDEAAYKAVVPGLGNGAYHIYDYQFFFRNLQENVRLRTESFLRAGAGDTVSENADGESGSGAAEEDAVEDAAEDPGAGTAADDAPGQSVPEETAAQEQAWDASVSPEITEEVRALFDQAMSGLLGVGYEPLTLLGTKETEEGTLYCVLCRAMIVHPEAKPYYTLVYILDDHSGTPQLQDIRNLELDDLTEPVQDDAA